MRSEIKTEAGKRDLPLLPLGHARVSVTLEIYTHGDNESHRDGLGKVAGELFGDRER